MPKNSFTAAASFAAILFLSSCETPGTSSHPGRPPQPGSQPQYANASHPRPAAPRFSGSIHPRAPHPSVSARAVIVIHANTGTVLYQKNADVHYPVASTQKLMMALLLVEAGNMNKNIRVASSDTRVEPAKMGLRSGEVYRKDDLLRAVLVRSSNDIA
ncbi:MAG: D-alanyl-D-alanine carboxypeptidase, partial [Verrucomicrobia bacterium]|nr:D-alanyl-D-alanine carboxypeptidase [Verrucomicrobiota bacterium]